MLELILRIIPKMFKENRAIRIEIFVVSLLVGVGVGVTFSQTLSALWRPGERLPSSREPVDANAQKNTCDYFVTINNYNQEIPNMLAQYQLIQNSVTQNIEYLHCTNWERVPLPLQKGS